MHWTQNYAPFPDSPVLSTVCAALPVVVLLGSLATGRVSAHVAALAGLVTAVLVAVFVFTPQEASWEDWASAEGVAGWGITVLTAVANGGAFGLFPIGWIVLAAIFLYSLTVETGRFEIVKHSVISLSSDRRIQALLIAFCFGAFVEGAAGFGTPVAISAALLMGAGFRPLHAAGLALIANTSPVAFGALGTPITTLAKVSLPAGADADAWAMQISRMAGRQLPFFSLLVPAWLVWTMAGWRGVVGVWPALLVCGGSFALVQFLTANYVGPALVDVAGGLVSLAALALFLRVWQPARTWQFAEEPPHPNPSPPSTGERGFEQAVGPHTPNGEAEYSRKQIIDAWVPWLFLSLFVFLAGIPQIRDWLNGISILEIEVEGLHNRVSRAFPVVPRPTPEEAIFKLNWLSATGTAIFVSAILTAFWLRIPPQRFLHIFGKTCYRMRWPLFTIACMLALAYVTRYSGVDATLGLAFTHTGWIYPFFAALLGWLGVALTGSDTSSNALFGSLQKITAQKLYGSGILPVGGETQAVLLLTTANSTGGVMGKMIDAQSIVVSAAATQQPGQEGAILRFVFWHSLALAILMGLLVMAQAYILTWMIP
jgi:lactate permease